MRYEAKKTYRTVRGQTAQVCNDHGSGQHLPYRIVVLGDAAWADREGTFQFEGKTDRMLAGAIEDEKSSLDACVYPHCTGDAKPETDVVLTRVVNLMNKIETMGVTIAGMAAKIEEMQSSIDATINGVSKLYEERADRTKPTIKAGWVNVYDYGHGVLHTSPFMFKTRKQCDSEGTNFRIACIQIPDFTEGEGL